MELIMRIRWEVF